MAALSLAQAEALAAEALTRNRTAAENAASVARALVLAEADGLSTHGLMRIPAYAAQARAGKVDGFATPLVSRPRPALARVDAAHGFAYPALEAATALLPELAHEEGIAAASITRSHHCGAAGHPVERLAEAGLVALLFANTPAAMAPWGGRKPVFGTNPIAFAAPLPGRPPLVIDLSLSKVARGHVIAAAQKGEAIPEGWALDSNGCPTTDPKAALAGTMVPLGDAKGTALALMVELLAAGLTGAHFAAEASSFLDGEGPPPDTGQFLIAIDPAASGGSPGHFARLADAIESDPGARLPGTRRQAFREKAACEGLAIPDALIAQITAL